MQPALCGSPDWPSAARTTYVAVCGFMAAEPDFARLRAIEVYGADEGRWRWEMTPAGSYWRR